MGPFATAVLVGCLQALGWFSWATAALVGAAIIAQYVRHDEMANPLGLAALALALAAAGFASRRVAALLTRKPR